MKKRNCLLLAEACNEVCRSGDEDDLPLFRCLMVFSFFGKLQSKIALFPPSLSSALVQDWIITKMKPYFYSSISCSQPFRVGLYACF